MSNPESLAVPQPESLAASNLRNLLPTLAKGCGQRSLGAIANLANLLPTGTVLIFEALISSFSNNGTCRFANKSLTWFAIVFCLGLCIFSCFTDSFIGKNDGQLYYGIATRNGFWVFNDTDSTDDSGNEELNEDIKRKHKLKWVDIVHAIMSAAVFLAFALSRDEVKRCLISNPGPDGKELIKNLPLVAAVMGSFLFTILPSKRTGIGYAGRAPD